MLMLHYAAIFSFVLHQHENLLLMASFQYLTFLSDNVLNGKFLFSGNIGFFLCRFTDMLLVSFFLSGFFFVDHCVLFSLSLLEGSLRVILAALQVGQVVHLGILLV